MERPNHIQIKKISSISSNISQMDKTIHVSSNSNSPLMMKNKVNVKFTIKPKMGIINVPFLNKKKKKKKKKESMYLIPN